MPIEMHLWRIDDAGPQSVPPSTVPLEKYLEDIIVSEPSILGEPLLVLARQVPTGRGFIDILAVDAEGILHVIELKRDKTPREVTAQVLDYGSWVSTLSHDQVNDIYRGSHNDSLSEAYALLFGDQTPDDLNVGHTLTIVAGMMDPATESIVNYLNDQFSVPINILFFRYFVDGDRTYLARTWLRNPNESEVGRAASGQKKSQEPWNGKDWYVSFGADEGSRNWDDARKYGFISGGQGAWYSKTLHQLPIGGRIFTYIPKVGYVGIGEVIAEAVPFERAIVQTDDGPTPLSSLVLQGSYSSPEGTSDDMKEWVVAVSWLSAVDRKNAVKLPGLFANQNTACKLRSSFTIDTVERILLTGE